MSSGYDFDFNADRPRFSGLDLQTDALLTETVASEPGSRVRAILALAAARSLLVHDFVAPDANGAHDALTLVAAELAGVEYALRDLEDGAPAVGITAARATGRPAESNAVIDFQARAVVAVQWLQRLQDKSLSRNAAVAAVAKSIPRALLHSPARRLHEDEKLTEVEQLEAWIDASGRRGSRRNGRVREVWHELIVGQGVHLEKQSSSSVLQWLDAEKQRLLGG